MARKKRFQKRWLPCVSTDDSSGVSQIKTWECSVPFKNQIHLHKTHSDPSAHFKSSLKYLWYLLPCRCCARHWDAVLFRRYWWATSLWILGQISHSLPPQISICGWMNTELGFVETKNWLIFPFSCHFEKSHKIATSSLELNLFSNCSRTSVFRLSASLKCDYAILFLRGAGDSLFSVLTQTNSSWNKIQKIWIFAAEALSELSVLLCIFLAWWASPAAGWAPSRSIAGLLWWIRLCCPLSKCPATEQGPRTSPGRDRRTAEVSLCILCVLQSWGYWDLIRGDVCKMLPQPICLEVALPSPRVCKVSGLPLLLFPGFSQNRALLWWKGVHI